MVVLAQPAAFSGWDPLLQRFVSLAAPQPSGRPPPISTGHSLRCASLQSASPAQEEEAAQPATPSVPQVTTPAEARTSHVTSTAPQTPEELEVSSLALAWRLQQEEQADFMRAMSSSKPLPRPEGTAFE
ncbi:MAG: hypothetical protein SGPRY_009225, partial [Prymnesium sp.]